MKGPRAVQAPFQNTTTNTYGQITPEDTADIRALRDFEFEEDPAQPYIFAEAKRRVDQTFDNPYGSYTTGALREAQQRAAHQDIASREGQASREGNFQRQFGEYGQRAALAELTAPRIVQTGGTSSGFNSQVVNQPGTGQLLAQGGLAALSAF